MTISILERRLSCSAACRALAGVILAVASLAAHAGLFTPCTDPIVLPRPKVQVFILPYQAESTLTERGRELATIVQRHVLFAALKYRSIAVAELTGDPQQCGFEKAAARVYPLLKNGQAAIFLWGRIFEQGEAIRLQSTVAFSARGNVDTIEWSLGGDEPTKTSATVPSDPVTFAPRVIPLSFLQMLESAQREARRLHSSPNANSSFWELPDDPEARFGFEVVETRDDWMRIRLFPRGNDGWIPAHALATGSNLKGKFPELYFVDGLIGYHELWNTSARPAIAGSRFTLESTRASFDEYIKLAAGRAESEARALAAILKGNATLRAAGDGLWSTALLQDAERYYKDAQRLSPTSTVANNFLLACSSVLCARGACREGSDQLHAQYLSAIAQDPTSVELVANLNAFYEAAKSGRINVSASRDEIERQRAMTKRVQSTMR